MTSSPLPSREIPVDVLPPLSPNTDVARSRENSSPGPPLSGLRTFYHPASGVAILGIDLICFGPEVVFPFGLPVMCALAFLATFPFVYFFQLKWSKNSPATALRKAFLGAFLAGLPFSIAGTLFGAAVIGMAGLPRHPFDAVKKVIVGSLKLGR